LPGLHILAAPKRAARGRAEERLVLHLTLPPDLALNADQQHRLLDDLAQGYFRTPGAVTSALREQAERLNAYFLQLNQNGQLGAVRLSMLSIREDRATLGQSGPLQAFLLDDAAIQHFYDPQASGRGLGLSKNVDVRFYQSELKTGSILLLLSELPTGWNEKTLSDVSGQKLSTLRRRFLSQAGPNLRAALIAAQPGNGRLSLLTSLEIEQPTPAAEVATVQSRAVPVGPRVAKAETEWESVEIPGSKQPSPENIPPVFHSAVSEPEINYFRDFSSRLKGVGEHVFPRLRSFLLRMLPEEPLFNLPRRTMAIIAIAVPLAVVVLVSVVYLQFGRVQLYTNYLAQAQSAAAVAEAREDPADIRAAWTTALFYAQRAVAYEKDTQTASALASQAQTALDELDGIARVDFQPALFSNLPRTANITRLAATNTDLFMLNTTDGSVLRAFLTGGGYQLDQDFHCEPGPYGGIIVSPLVDLALLPRGNKQGAVVVAMDGNGNLIYCFEGQRPLAVSLIPPDSNWGKPNAIAVENGNLYVLDPLTNAVWIYFGEDYSFAQPPRFFFGAQVPDMQNMLDLSMDGEDLYLLDADGHLAICTFNDALDNPTTCTDPAEFTDPRAGRQSGAQIADAHFLQLQLTDPPEPSVYLFDPIVSATYQFSTHLNLVRQFQSSSTLPGEVASAFTVSPNHAIFLAFQNEIYIGFMP
jgi:hypothetical protein